MRRRLIIGGAVLSGVIFASLLGYRLLDLPPIKLALRHGLTPTAAPTGRSCVRGRHKVIELGPADRTDCPGFGFHSLPSAVPWPGTAPSVTFEES